MTIERPGAPPELPRSLGLASAIAVVVGSTIGSGIFKTPAVVAEHVPDPRWFAALWLAGGGLALAGALSIAQLASSMPQAGGLYVYLRERYGRAWAFSFGWTELVILRPAAYGAIALVFGEYACAALELGASDAVLGVLARDRALAIAAIASLGALNLRGVALGAWIQNVSAALKLLALLGLVAAVVVWLPAAPAPAVAVDPAPAPGLAAVVTALVAVMWAYDGWADLGFLAGEVKRPERALPRALGVGTALVVGSYLLVCWAYAQVVPVAVMGGRPLVAADVAHATLGAGGERAIAAAIALSAFGALNGSLMTGPRVFFAMGRDGLGLGGLGYVHPRWQTPSRAIALSIALGIGFVSVRSFADLTEHFVIAIWPFYLLAVLSVARRPAVPAPFSVPGGPVLPLAFAAASALMLVVHALTEPVRAGVTFAVLALGLLIYWLGFGRRGQP